MSKSDGQYIGLTFTDEITSDLALVHGYDYEKNLNVTVSVRDSGSDIAKMANGNYSDYGYLYNGVGQWIQLHLPLAKRAGGMRWYVVSAGEAFATFTVSGSNDGVSFTYIDTVSGDTTVGWKEFQFDSLIAYEYYRFTAISYAGTRFFCYEIEMKTHPLGVEKAFSIVWNEYNYVLGGTLVQIEHQPYTIQHHPTVEKALLLGMKSPNYFRSAVGNIKVVYDSRIGNLAGQGGPVASFEQLFTPEELLAKPHQNDQENVAISNIDHTGILTFITYINSETVENIGIYDVATSSELIHINDL